MEFLFPAVLFNFRCAAFLFYQTQSLTENRYKGHNYKMTAEQEKAVVKFVKEHFVTSTKVVINWIKEHWGIVYSEQGMKNFLNRHGFVYKKPKGIPGKHPSAEEQRAVIQELTSIMEECAAHEKEEIYFLDGSGFTHNLKLGYGWIEKGQEKFFKTNTSREKINVNGAYNPLTQEVICIEHEENVNQQSNMKLIDKILEKDFKGTEKHKLYLVMDNARYNHGKLFQAHLEKWKREKRMEIEVLYLPPYSPNLNVSTRLFCLAIARIKCPLTARCCVQE